MLHFFLFFLPQVHHAAHFCLQTWANPVLRARYAANPGANICRL